MNNKYIYESPDKGKTVFRRAFGHCEKEIQVGVDWFNFDEAKEIFNTQKQEEELRRKHPALKNAWDNYQLILKLVMETRNETR